MRHPLLRRGPPLGFTLIELLTSMVMTSVILAGLGGIMVGFNRSFEANARTREAIGSSRMALNFLQRRVQLAGYGMNPQQAFDFTPPGTGRSRDSSTGPDELVFYSRDPLFQRRATYTAGNLALDAALKTTLYRGQVLLLICTAGSSHRYLQVTTTVSSGNAVAVADTTTPALPSDTSTNECLSNASAAARPYLVKLDRYRFFVADVTESVGVTRRYLLLDQGLDLNAATARTLGTEPVDPDGAGPQVIADSDLLDVAPLIPNVEDFQVAYEMNRPDTGGTPVDGTGGNWVLGDGTAPDEPNPTATAPQPKQGYTHANRYTAHPANIRGIRLNLVTRSTQPIGSGKPITPLENRVVSSPVDDGLFRNLIRVQIKTPNLLSRSVFTPVQLANAWGG